MLPQHSSSKSRMRVLFITVALLLINGAIFNVFTKQLLARTRTQNVVKDDHVSLSPAGKITITNTIETIPPADDKPIITVYTVVSGDTISGIAEKFGVSTNTIRWANNLTTKSLIAVGDKLTILPVTGIQYTVKKGDTLSGIAVKFDADQAEITEFNELGDDKKITVGMKLIIPDAEPLVVKSEPKKTTPQKSSSAPKSSSEVQKKSEPSETKESSSSTETSLAHPVPGAILTQGKHGYNGVDFGTPIGTPIYAAASGTVIVAKPEGYNGGYGKYIVIEHSNGTQTLYGHLSDVSVAVGESVTKGDQIGKSGNTGKSTGPHLHFEVRGGTNPWTSDKKGTHY